MPAVLGSLPERGWVGNRLCERCAGQWTVETARMA